MTPSALGTPAVGVLMAGGEGRRMVTGGQTIPKPLVPVLGVPLVERNVWAFLRSGITDIRVVVSARDAGLAVSRWANNRGARLAKAVGAQVRVVVEPDPLGNCGALAIALEGDDPRPVVLAFADNLTDLDLTQLLSTMRNASASLVLAVHDQPFRLPYGVVDVSGDRVGGYREKPEIPIRVGSGLAIVGADSRSLVDGAMGLVDLVNRTIAAGQLVVAHSHGARWVDVNDPSLIRAAEAMVRAHPKGFERWLPVGLIDRRIPDCLSAQGGRGVLLDDLDSSGRPVRIWSGTVDPSTLSEEGQARVWAWHQCPITGAESKRAP